MDTTYQTKTKVRAFYFYIVPTHFFALFKHWLQLFKNQETKISLTILNFHYCQLIQLTAHITVILISKIWEGGRAVRFETIFKYYKLTRLSNIRQQRACTLHNTHRSKCSHSNFNPKNELKYGLKHYFDIQHAIPNNYIFSIHTSSSGNQAVKAYKLSSSNL